MDLLQYAGIILVKILIVANIMLITVSYLVYFERKISAWVQDRIGPNRVGPLGLLQPFADVLKLLLKEDIVPEKAFKTIHTLAPLVALFVAFTTYAVIPIGPPEAQLWGVSLFTVAPDLNIGILYVLALTSVGVYAITFSGWSSGSKYSLLGGIRSSAQMISYEISMGFSIAGVLLISQSLDPQAIVGSQAGLWNMVIQPIGFIVFVVSAFAETNRLPFDLPEAEPELVGGFHTEYSSMKFAGFFLAEYANMIIASGMIVTLYLGGWQIPFVNEHTVTNDILRYALQVASFFVKMGALLFFFIWVRWSLPRFRYDQLMDIGWKVMFPLSLINLIWVAVYVMLIS